MTSTPLRFLLPDGPRPVVDWAAPGPASLLHNLQHTAAVAGAQPMLRVTAALDVLGPSLLDVVLPGIPCGRALSVTHTTESAGLFTFPVEDHQLSHTSGAAHWEVHLHRMYNGHMGGWEETVDATLTAPSGTLALHATHWGLLPQFTVTTTQLGPSAVGTLMDLICTTLGLVPGQETP